jgi:hypothetical protein
MAQLFVGSSTAEASRASAASDRQVLAAAEQFASAAKPIDVMAFDVSYSDGKEVERLREWAERTPADAKEILEALRQSEGSGKLHLMSGFMFTTILEQRIGHCEALTAVLSSTQRARRATSHPLQTTIDVALGSGGLSWSAHVQRFRMRKATTNQTSCVCSAKRIDALTRAPQHVNEAPPNLILQHPLRSASRNPRRFHRNPRHSRTPPRSRTLRSCTT